MYFGGYQKMAPFILPIPSNLSKTDHEREINTLMLFPTDIKGIWHPVKLFVVTVKHTRLFSKSCSRKSHPKHTIVFFCSTSETFNRGLGECTLTAFLNAKNKAKFRIWNAERHYSY